jgi:CDP-2,3-bis-(O-geranylgeranyl)-sn-glycerol synthase
LPRRLDRFMHPFLLFQLLVLLTVANGAPVVAKRLIGDRLNAPLDGGTMFYDDMPLFGPSKTIRGIVVSLLATVIAAWLMGFSWTLGVLVAAAAMLGDLFTSFLKRRMTLPSSSMALGLDHIPESLLPLMAACFVLPLSALDVLVGVVAFCAGALLLSPILYRFNLRDRPY